MKRLLLCPWMPLVIVVLAAFGCTGTFPTDDGGVQVDAAPPALLLGAWQEPAPTAHVLTFTSDGHLRETAAGQLVSESLYTLEGDQLLLIAVAGLCSVDPAERNALYRIALDASTLHFTLLSDACPTRQRLGGETFTRLAADTGL